MDTVLQHARMYGYRQSELAAIRIYLPRHLAERFSSIHISDNLVREQCQVTHQPIQLIPLISGGIRPTRRNVLNENTVVQVRYQGGRQYFPSLPISDPNILGHQTYEIDNLLSTSRYLDLKQAYTVTIDDLLEILNFQYGMAGSSGAWNDERIRQAVSALRDQSRYTNRASLVIVNRSANIGKSEGRNDQVGAVLPGNIGNVPYGIDRNYPALLMTRNNGSLDKGWNGDPFWIPVIRFPDGNYAFSVNES
jgi:hypothetical protein